MKEQIFQPYIFYAWQNEKGALGIETCSRYGLVYARVRNYLDNQLRWDMVNAEEEADFKSVSSFKIDSYCAIDRHGKKKFLSGRNERFIYSILTCFVDLDSDLTLGEDIILQRCRALKLPFPTYILETSVNHFLCSWEFKDQLYIYKRTMLDYWRLVQKSLFRTFRDLGGDGKFISDATCYLRNPKKVHAYNKKYSHKPKVKLVYEGQSVTLSDIYYSLKEAGFVKQ